jgi:indole-3-glycerol phosphate synthase
VTGGFLQRIVRSTRAAIADPSYRAGLPDEGPRTRPSLRSALLQDTETGALVAEFKRRSPGAVEPELPVHTPSEFLATLEPAPVSAYSCLATPTEFLGSPRDVLAIAGGTRRPVLFKEFVVDPVQLEVAARAGASAVLLIARLETLGLLTLPLAELAREAHARGLEVVLEWHDRTELRRTEEVPADVYGVNVRDLDTLEIHREVAAETLRAAGSFRPLLGMSGVDGPAEAARFWSLGADGILVGSALARASDPARFLAELRRARAGVAA